MGVAIRPRIRQTDSSLQSNRRTAYTSQLIALLFSPHLYQLRVKASLTEYARFFLQGHKAGSTSLILVSFRLELNREVLEGVCVNRRLSFQKFYTNDTYTSLLTSAYF